MTVIHSTKSHHSAPFLHLLNNLLVPILDLIRAGRQEIVQSLWSLIPALLTTTVNTETPDFPAQTPTAPQFRRWTHHQWVADHHPICPLSSLPDATQRMIPCVTSHPYLTCLLLDSMRVPPVEVTPFLTLPVLRSTILTPIPHLMTWVEPTLRVLINLLLPLPKIIPGFLANSTPNLYRRFNASFGAHRPTRIGIDLRGD